MKLEGGRSWHTVKREKGTNVQRQKVKTEVRLKVTGEQV